VIIPPGSFYENVRRIIMKVFNVDLFYKLQIIEVDRNYEDPDTGVAGRVRRNPYKPVPEYSEARQKFIQERTVFVAGFPREGISMDQIIDFFENNFEQVSVFTDRCFS